MLFIIFWPWVMGAARIAFGDVGVDYVWPTGGSLESIFPIAFLEIIFNFWRASMWRPCCCLFSFCNYITD